MVFNFKNKHELSELRTRITELENALGKANLRLRMLDSEVADATPMIDFDTMRVFSIERNRSENDVSYTTIGYYMQEPVMSNDGEMVIMKDVVREWLLHCNISHHEQLVKNFIAWKQTATCSTNL